MDDTIRRLKELTDASDNIVFFGGAGVSTESGIPDFRSVDGLYHQKFKYPPETMLSHTFYETHTEEFYDFYRAKMLALDAQPNPLLGPILAGLLGSWALLLVGLWCFIRCPKEAPHVPEGNL